jgi:hypothetical protein
MGDRISRSKEKLYYNGNIVKTNKNRVYSITKNDKNHHSEGCCCPTTIYTGQRNMFVKEIFENKTNTTKIEHFFAKRGKKIMYMYSVHVENVQKTRSYDRRLKYWVTERTDKQILSEHKGEFLVDEHYLETEETPILYVPVREPGETEGCIPSAPPETDLKTIR